MFEDKLFKEIFESQSELKLLIVPAQLTLSAEQAAFDYAKVEAFFDFRVMSGNKLRAEIINTAGGLGKTPINTLGRAMLLRRIAKEKAPELSVYRSCAASSQFISYAGDFIVQMKQNNPEGIDLKAAASEFAGGTAAQELLFNKLLDMALLSSEYEKAMSGKYSDAGDSLAYAAQKAAECPWLKESEIWFEGFYSFTPAEEKFLKALEANSLGLHINYSAPADMKKFIYALS